MWLLLYHRTRTHGRWPDILAGAAAALPAQWMVVARRVSPTTIGSYSACSDLQTGRPGPLGSATKQRTLTRNGKALMLSGLEPPVPDATSVILADHLTPSIGPPLSSNLPDTAAKASLTTVAFDQDATGHSSRGPAARHRYRPLRKVLDGPFFTHPSSLQSTSVLHSPAQHRTPPTSYLCSRLPQVPGTMQVKFDTPDVREQWGSPTCFCWAA